MPATAHNRSPSRATSSKASSSGGWKKHVCFFVADRSTPWLHSHAALPCTLQSGGETSVFFSSRDEHNRAHVGRFGYDLTQPALVAMQREPALEPGTLGAFDDSGVTVSCVVEHANRYWLYYTGWSLGVSVPFYLGIGLATSHDGQTFTRVSRAPILDRSDIDPFMTASPCVLIEDGVWRMWYVSCQRWEPGEPEPKHYYHIRYAESRDGIHWERDGRVCIDFEDESEFAFGRPCVVKDGDTYRMWYCVRGENYRIGYAESADGLTWQRRDAEAGIAPSGVGWDSEMQAYPWVFDTNGKRWMLYNGNGYGQTGIGLAEWIE
jgi:hypothetical protein